MPPVHVDKDHGVDGVLSSYNSIIYLFLIKVMRLILSM